MLRPIYRIICLSAIFLYIVFLKSSPGYALVVVSGPDTDGCYVIRAEGSDIISDESIVSDLAVSRDGGQSWLTILRDDNKAINWLEAKGTQLVSVINVPAGHYNAVRIKSGRNIKVSLEDRPGRPAREAQFDLGGDLEFALEYIDMTVEKDGKVSLRFDNPLIYLELYVRWDININAYADPQIVNSVFKKDIYGSAFIIDSATPAPENQ